MPCVVFEVVSEDCSRCGLCEERAPDNIETPSGSDTSQVVKQPETSEEEEACTEAYRYCPMGALQMSDSPPPSQRWGNAS